MRSGEEFADWREEADVGGRVRTRRATDWALVDLDHLVDLIQARDAVVRPRSIFRAVQPARERLLQNVGDEGALATPGDAGDCNEFAERKRDVELAQIMLARALDRNRLATPLTASLRNCHGTVATQVGTGDGVLRGEEILEGSV